MPAATAKVDELGAKAGKLSASVGERDTGGDTGSPRATGFLAPSHQGHLSGHDGMEQDVGLQWQAGHV